MNVFHYVILVCTAGLLGACSSSSETTAIVGGVSQNSGGVYSVTVNGTTTAISKTPFSTGYGFKTWIGTGSYLHKGYVYESGSVVAIAVMDVATDTTIAGISGTAATDVPVTGSASYTGGFSLTYYRGGTTNDSWNAFGAFITDVDFAEGTVTGSGVGNFASTLSVAGVLTGSEFNGVAQFSATEYSGSATALMTGGLYGTDTVAGIYQSDTATGVFHGVSP